MRLLRVALAGLSAFVSFSSGALALDLYVSKSGTDQGSDCQSSASPCLTLQYAVARGLLINLNGANLQINLLGTGRWDESVIIAGPLSGSANTKFQSGQVLLSGNSASNTTIAGAPGQCGTIIASSGAQVGVQNLRLTGTASSCSSIYFSQLGGSISQYGGVVLGSANAQTVHAESTGSQVHFWSDFTIEGGASLFALADRNAEITFDPVGGAPTATISGFPTFQKGFIGAQYNGSVYIGAGWTFLGFANGPQHFLDQNGIIFNAAKAPLPGSSIGFSLRGGRYYPPTPPTLSRATGLGNDGSVSISEVSGSRGGFLTLSVGSVRTASTGSITLTFANDQVGQDTSRPGPCVATTAPGVGRWSPGASVAISGYGQSQIQLTWDNNGSNLTGGSSYQINYICDSPG